MNRKNNFPRQHQKYSCVKPEDMYVHKLYTLSYNPEEQPLFERFYRMKLNNLKDWSNKCKEIFTLKYADIDVVLEISSKGRFHYHGHILVHDIPRFIIHDLAKLRHYGTYEIDSISELDDGANWGQYVRKQQRFMQGYAEWNEMEYNIVTEAK